ncbi:TolB-like translocation protein [Hymenobacter metallicola]|uniref:PD40 domain-containing protein n=1 Tax=Hymenobacter metallicola TaxID=2563114 RepID=UPI001436716D|nr:PD40 domain-containing protein [Hymenobacter metallicola]
MALSKDGREAYFTDSDRTRTRLRLMQSRRVAGRWQAPTPVPFASPFRDIDPVFSPDGQRLYFNSTRPYDGSTTERPNFDVWVVSRTRTGWSEPQRVAGVSQDSTSESYASIARNGTMYFTSTRRGGPGKSDIYASELTNGRYQPAVALAINTAGSDGNPFISADNHVLLFLSDRPGGYGGTDLYVCYRQGKGWSQPYNLGPKVNTAGSDFCPALSADGRTLYFSRTERSGNTIVREDLYSIPVAELDLPKEIRRRLR